MKVENIAESIYQTLVDKDSKEPERLHLGASIIGEKCARKIWLSFRHVTNKNFSGRILRLFRRGKEEENNAIKDLIAAGVPVRSFDKNGQQYSFEDGHFGGSCDGIIPGDIIERESPVNEFTTKPAHVLEIKTHSKKSFEDMKKNGCKMSKPMHYAQCQTYMLKFGVDSALYFAICKDNDELYFEQIALDKGLAESLVDRAHMIATAQELPAPLSNDPTWFECKMCDYHKFCHITKTTERVHCQTCAKCEPRRGGSWFCHEWMDNVPKHAILLGCDKHVLHASMVPFSLLRAEELAGGEMGFVFEINGKEVLNGTGGWSSKEILANPAACANPSSTALAIKEKFGAKLTG